MPQAGQHNGDGSCWGVLCLQVKDKWDFRMTARYEMYADLFSRYTQPDFQQQIVKDPSLAAAVPSA
jgi:beta-ureidopropionase